MHIVAAYLCGLNYKDVPKNSKETGEVIDCYKLHLDEFNKLDEFKRGLLEQIPIKDIVDQTIEEIVGFEQNVFKAINQGVNAKKMESKVNEYVENNFMLDLF